MKTAKYGNIELVLWNSFSNVGYLFVSFGCKNKSFVHTFVKIAEEGRA